MYGISTIRGNSGPPCAKSRYFYGNLGRDMIGQFERMTLNFQSISIIFEQVIAT